jgi:hypothetical protein
VNSAKNAAIATSTPNVAGSGLQSTMRPPMTLPATIPSPQTASAIGTSPLARPARSVRIGLM